MRGRPHLPRRRRAGHERERTTLHLVDHHRRDPGMPDRARELMATVTPPGPARHRYPSVPRFSAPGNPAGRVESRVSAPSQGERGQPRAIYTPILGMWTTAQPATGVALPQVPGAAVVSAEYKLSILAEYDAASETGEKGASCAARASYSSLITDWRRQHRQGLLKAAVGRSDGGRGGPSPQRGGQVESGERTAAVQARPGRGHHRCPGKSAHALGGDLEERGARRRHLNAVLDTAVDELVAAGIRRRRACQVLGRSRPATTGAAKHLLHGPPTPRPRSHRALTLPKRP